MAITFNSCSKEDFYNSQIENNQNFDDLEMKSNYDEELGYLSDQELKSVIDEISFIHQNIENLEQAEVEYQRVLQPFEEIGSKIFNIAYKDANLDDSSLGLSNEEKFAIQNMRSQDFAAMGFALNLANSGYVDQVENDRALHCLGVAIGVVGIYDLIQNTRSLAAFGEATTQRQMLRLAGRLGRRFLGWIGVAIMINDFAACMWD